MTSSNCAVPALSFVPVFRFSEILKRRTHPLRAGRLPNAGVNRGAQFALIHDDDANPFVFLPNTASVLRAGTNRPFYRIPKPMEGHLAAAARKAGRETGTTITVENEGNLVIRAQFLYTSATASIGQVDGKFHIVYMLPYPPNGGLNPGSERCLHALMLSVALFSRV